MAQAIREYESALDSSQPFRAFSTNLDSIEPEMPKVVAEYLVNNIDSLPIHYMTHKFWQSFGSGFSIFKNQPKYSELRDAVKSLLEASIALQNELKSHRLKLCRDFDIPAAQPVLPAPSEDLYAR